MKHVATRSRFRAVALGIGASSLAFACSFGEIDDPSGDIDPVGGEELTDPNSTPVITNVPSGMDVPGASTTEEPESIDEEIEDVQDPPTPNTVDPNANQNSFGDSDEFQSELGRQVFGILEANCGGCHANGAQNGGLDYILDFQSLVDNDKIVRGSKENSNIWIRMDQLNMPPAFIREQRPTLGDIALVGQFIDELQPDEEACEALEHISRDEMWALMQQDVLRQDAGDQPFTRYLGVTYASNAGLCGRDLEVQRFALFKGINSLSLNPRVTQPVAIDSNELLYRIDIRDYDWDRGIDLEDDGIVDFDDAWDAILDGVGQYAVEYTGDEADIVNQLTETDVPFLPVNAMIQFTNLDDLYYALIGARENIFDFELEVLGIDAEANIDEGEVMRGGFATSGVSKQERVVTRQPNGVAGNLNYWLSFDFEDGIGANESIYSDPLGFAFAGGEAIFSLPNGFQAYYVAAADGTRLAEAPAGVVIDPSQNNGIVTNGASCHSCHNAGLIPFTDTVREYVLENVRDFDAQTLEDVQEQYATQDEWNDIFAFDSETHVRATEQAGVPRGTPDPIGRVFLQFQLGDVTTALAAGELGVRPEELVADANRLDARFDFNDLENGRTDRNTFTSVYLDSICIMQSFSQNRPANCE